jgi:hypothetical protein
MWRYDIPAWRRATATMKAALGVELPQGGKRAGRHGYGQAGVGSAVCGAVATWVAARANDPVAADP